MLWPTTRLAACLLAVRPSHRCAPPHCAESRIFSADFSTACEAQLEVLSELITPLAGAAIFARSENPKDGNLEFYPVAVWPVAQGVFYVGENTPAVRQSPSLPGRTDASLLLPGYPFLPTELTASTMSDGGLSVPLAYKANMLGVLAIWREGRSGDGDAPPKPARAWTSAERRQAERVARTLAVAAVLDRGNGGAAAEAEPPPAPPVPPPQQQTPLAGVDLELARRSRRRTTVVRVRPSLGVDGGSGRVSAESHALLLREISALLAASVHQLNSPLSAVRTLAKLLLRRLEGDDLTNREIARDILIQAERLSELIQVHPLSIRSLSGRLWPSLAFSGRLRPSMTFYGLLQPSPNLSG